MCNSHYVPRSILRRFGGHIQEFRIWNQDFRHGLTPDQAFYAPGLYEDDVEQMLCDDIESNLRYHLRALRNAGNNGIPIADADFLRNYMVISLLRTPSVGSMFERGRWNDLLRTVIRNGYSRSVAEEFIRIGNESIFEKADLIISSSIRMVCCSRRTDTFLISDRGVSFPDDREAVYPFSGR